MESSIFTARDQIPITSIASTTVSNSDSPSSRNDIDKIRRLSFLPLTNFFSLQANFKFKEKHNFYTLPELILTSIIKHAKFHPVEKWSLKYMMAISRLINSCFKKERLSFNVKELFEDLVKKTHIKWGKEDLTRQNNNGDFLVMLLEKDPEIDFNSQNFAKIQSKLLDLQISQFSLSIKELKQCSDFYKATIDNLKFQVIQDSRNAFRNYKNTKPTDLKSVKTNFSGGRNYDDLYTKTVGLAKIFERAVEEIVRTNPLGELEKIGENSKKTLLAKFSDSLNNYQAKLKTQCSLIEEKFDFLVPLRGLRRLMSSVGKFINENSNESNEPAPKLPDLDRPSTSENKMENLRKNQKTYTPTPIAAFTDIQVTREKTACFAETSYSNFEQPDKKIKQMLELWSLHAKLLRYLSSNFKESASRIEVQVEKPEDYMSLIDEEEREKAVKRRKKAIKGKEDSSKQEIAKPTIQESFPAENEPEKNGLNVHQPILTSPSNDIFSKFEFGDKTNLYIPSEVAVRLNQAIQQSSQLTDEQMKTLSRFKKKCYKIAIEEAKDHLFLAACGFEVFMEAISEGHFEALGTIVSALMLDWHGIEEQTRRSSHILIFKKIFKTHHLESLSKAINENENQQRVESLSEHLNSLDNAQIWARYPESQRIRSPDPMPKGLEMLYFAQKFSNAFLKGNKNLSQEIEGVEKLIDFVCNKHFFCWLNIARLLCPKQLTPSSIEAYNTLINGYRCDLKTYAKERLEGINSAAANRRSNANLLQDSLVKRLRTLMKANKKNKNIKVFDNPYALLGDVKRHVQNVSIASILKQSNKTQVQHHEAWHHRNRLNMQWALEQTYRYMALGQGIKGIKAHNFPTFQKLLRSIGVPLNSAEEVDANVFNLGQMIYYPRFSTKIDDQNSPLIETFLQILKNCQMQAHDGSKGLWEKVKSRKNPKEIRPDADLDKAFTNARNIIGRYIAAT